MQLFYTINNWATQNAVLDGAMRVFYVAAIPFLATILAALLVFRPARFVADDARFLRVALSVVGAVAVCALIPLLVNAFSQSVLGAPILSSRPFVTHRVNALIVEPNDNTFPCGESAMIGALWLGIWAIAPSLAWPFAWYAILFCVARVFCGTNYPIDVAVGLAVGIALQGLSLSLWRVPLRRVRRFPWFRSLDTVFPRLRHQTLFALVLCGFCLVSLWHFGVSPNHDKRWSAFWKTRAQAILAGTRLVSTPNIEYSNRVAPSSDAPREGEGANETTVTNAANAEIPRVGTTTLGGNCALQARQLLADLKNAPIQNANATNANATNANATNANATNANATNMNATNGGFGTAPRVVQTPGVGLAHSIVSVDVASLKGDLHRDNVREERFAFVRFQVRASGNLERKRVLQTAQRIVQIAFARDAALQNVDVVGVVLSDPKRDNVKYAVFGDGLIPVFSASIQRKKLILTGAQPWLNWPNADAGSWLRARSRIGFNERVLPQSPPRVAATPIFQEKTVALQTSTPTETPPTTPQIETSPTATPKPTAPKAISPDIIAPKTPVLPNINAPNHIAPSVVARKTATPSRTLATKSNTPELKQNVEKPNVYKPRSFASSTRWRGATRERRATHQRRRYRRWRRYE